MLRIILSFFALLHCSSAFTEERIIEVGNASIFCTKIGTGSPLFILHGGPGLSQAYLRPQMEALAKENTLIFYDQRGGGSSTGDINPENINLSTFLDDLDQVRKAYGYDKISILGHSWGGFLALQYALKHPDKVEKLVVSNSLPMNSHDVSLFIQEWEVKVAPYLESIEKIKASPGFKTGDPRTFKNYYTEMFKGYCFNPDKADKLNLLMSPKANINSLKIMEISQKTILGRPFDLTQSLQSLQTPTLVIHGKEDVIPFETAERIYKALPQAKYVLIPNCGHFPYVETPETYFEEIRHFLKTDLPL